MHVGGDDDGDAGAAPLAVQHDHVAGVSVEPCVDGFTHTAQPLQGWGQVVRPPVLFHLNGQIKSVDQTQENIVGECGACIDRSLSFCAKR